MTVNPLPFIACHECDLLQREIPLAPGESARCRRCGVILYRNAPDSLDRTLAFTITAAVLFVVANIYPIIGIELQGNKSALNLFGAVHSIWDQEMESVALLVFITTILIPAFQLAAMIYLLLPLKLRRVPVGISLILRLLQSFRPWGMVEVFMLGVLVALVKLTHNFIVISGVALWSFGGLTFMLAAVASSFNARDVWVHVDRQPGREVSA